jgi:hypothetical protein
MSPRREPAITVTMGRQRHLFQGLDDELLGRAGADAPGGSCDPRWLFASRPGQIGRLPDLGSRRPAVTSGSVVGAAGFEPATSCV